MQLWPVTSTTLYEWINNDHLTPEDKVNLKRYNIPNHIIFSSLVIFTIILGQILMSNNGYY